MQRLHGLDALRGIAALIVLWHHVQEVYHFRVLNFAAISAVDLFLVLSGYVLARTYEPRGIPKDFIGKRFLRLAPLMAVGSTIGLVTFAAENGFNAALALGYAAILLLLPWPGLFALNQPAWSLCCELICNAVHGPLIGRASNRALAAGAALLFGIFATATYVMGRAPWALEMIDIPFAIARLMCCYIIGVLVWRTWGDRPMGNPLLGLIALPLSLLLLDGLNAIYSVVFAVVVAPLILRSAIGLGQSRLAEWGGSLSFPLYAVHMPVLVVCHGLGFNPILALEITLASGAVLALAAAYKKTIVHLWRTPRPSLP